MRRFADVIPLRNPVAGSESDWLERGKSGRSGTGRQKFTLVLPNDDDFGHKTGVFSANGQQISGADI
jgi:hypothetical protein